MAAQVFVFENVKDKEERHKLLQSALRDYCGIDSAEISYKYKERLEIKGTPNNLYASVTTAGEVMVCVFAEKPIGIDGEHLTRIKEMVHLDYSSIAEKVFTTEEAEYCRNSNDASEAINFANIWVRKEAYCKYAGLGLKEFHTFSVSSDEKIFSKVKGVPIKKFNPQFPGSSEYLFVIAGDVEV